MKRTIVVIIFIALLLEMQACNNHKPAENYFAKTGITWQSINNHEANEHIQAFKDLYNRLVEALKHKDDAECRQLTTEYADWILKAIEIKDKLPESDQEAFDAFMKTTNIAWDKLKE